MVTHNRKDAIRSVQRSKQAFPIVNLLCQVIYQIAREKNDITLLGIDKFYPITYLFIIVKTSTVNIRDLSNSIAVERLRKVGKIKGILPYLVIVLSFKNRVEDRGKRDSRQAPTQHTDKLASRGQTRSVLLFPAEKSAYKTSNIFYKQRQTDKQADDEPREKSCHSILLRSTPHRFTSVEPMIKKVENNRYCYSPESPMYPSC